jgi:hypothetical protein
MSSSKTPRIFEAFMCFRMSSSDGTICGMRNHLAVDPQYAVLAPGAVNASSVIGHGEFGSGNVAARGGATVQG